MLIDPHERTTIFVATNAERIHLQTRRPSQSEATRAACQFAPIACAAATYG